MIKFYQQDLDAQGLNQVILIAVLSVTECIGVRNDESCREVWGSFDELLDHLLSSDEEDRRYQEKLESFRGLPVPELKRKIQELNRIARDFRLGSTLKKEFARFENELITIARSREATDSEVII